MLQLYVTVICYSYMLQLYVIVKYILQLYVTIINIECRIRGSNLRNVRICYDPSECRTTSLRIEQIYSY